MEVLGVLLVALFTEGKVIAHHAVEPVVPRRYGLVALIAREPSIKPLGLLPFLDLFLQGFAKLIFVFYPLFVFLLFQDFVNRFKWELLFPI